MTGGHRSRTLQQLFVAGGFEGLPAAALTDEAQRVVSVNWAFTELTGYGADEVLGRNLRFLQGPRTDRAVVRAMREALDSGNVFTGEVLNYRKDGTVFWNRLTLIPGGDSGGRAAQFAGLLTDASDQVRLRAVTDRLLDAAEGVGSARTVEAVGESVVRAILVLGEADRAAFTLWDPDRRELRVAAIAAGHPADRETGSAMSADGSVELAALIAAPKPLLVHVADASDLVAESLRRFGMAAIAGIPILSDGAVLGFLLAYWREPTVPTRLTDEVIHRLTGIAGLSAIALDNVRLLQRAREAGERDGLTGLASRLTLNRRLVDALRDARNGEYTGVISCDVDRFKRTNDLLGHAGGDLVLRELAVRISGSVRPQDIVARPGGDEFVVVLPRVEERADVLAVLERLRSALHEPIQVGDQPIYVAVSAGTALGRLDDQKQPATAMATALLHRADSEMYEAKKGRRARPGHGGLREARLDADLHGAAARGEIVALFQPQVDLATGRVTGCEALARWHHPEYGTLLPWQFIPLAEDNDTIHEIGARMLHQACRLAKQAAAGGADIELSVNVSTRELQEPGYVDRLVGVLAEHGLAPLKLSIEVTESTLITDLAVVERALRSVREHQVGVSIDDFGTGYSSLSQLQDLPATELKVDRSFVQRKDAVGLSILGGVVRLAHEVGLRVVAEGVETRQQLATVRAAGCQRAQGYLLGRPMTAQRLLDRIAADGRPQAGDA